MRSVSTHFLVQRGHRVTAVDSERACAESPDVAEKGTYDAWLVDLTLPLRPFLRTLGIQRGVQSPLLLMTGYGDAQVEAVTSLLRPVAVLRKPFPLTELDAALRCTAPVESAQRSIQP